MLNKRESKKGFQSPATCGNVCLCLPHPLSAGIPNNYINVPVVFMAQYVMVLRGATSLQKELEGVGHENRDFFGP
jgi:hypothetical protein